MKIVSYFFVGGIAAAVDIGLFTLFAVVQNYNYLVVGACSFIIATFVNYFLSIRFVFESGIRFRKRHEIFMVFFVSFTGLLINQVILFIAIQYFSVWKLFAKLLATGLVFFWNYSIRHFFIFRSKTP